MKGTSDIAITCGHWFFFSQIPSVLFSKSLKIRENNYNCTLDGCRNKTKDRVEGKFPPGHFHLLQGELSVCVSVQLLLSGSSSGTGGEEGDC